MMMMISAKSKEWLIRVRRFLARDEVLLIEDKKDGATFLTVAVVLLSFD